MVNINSRAQEQRELHRRSHILGKHDGGIEGHAVAD